MIGIGDPEAIPITARTDGVDAQSFPVCVMSHESRFDFKS
jgi:hypothetical protein